MTEAAQPWSLRGAPVDKPRPRWVVLVLAVMVAFETFVERGDSYPLYRAVAVLASGAYVLFAGIQRKALLSLLAVPLAGLWVNPLIGGSLFTENGATFFLAHALYAVFLAVAGYTFMAYSPKNP